MSTADSMEGGRKEREGEGKEKRDNWRLTNDKEAKEKKEIKEIE